MPWKEERKTLTDWHTDLVTSGRPLTMEEALLASQLALIQNTHALAERLGPEGRLDGARDRWECWLVLLTQRLQIFFPWIPPYTPTQKGNTDYDQARPAIEAAQSARVAEIRSAQGSIP